MNLNALCNKFPAEDVEWRVSRAGVSKSGGIYCNVLCYITVRAVQNILDEVCGPENWALTQPIQLVHDKRCAVGVGISIRINDEWVTKWDVCELTDSNQNIPPFKGGFSGAVKRAGSQWGIFRYGRHIDETYADVSENDPGQRGWNWAKLPKRDGGAVYWWKTPTLPSWALPKKEEEAEVSHRELTDLKNEWRVKFAPDNTSRADMAEGFSRFVSSIVGDFPSSEHTCWTQDAISKCQSRINETTDPAGVSAEIPFDIENSI